MRSYLQVLALYWTVVAAGLILGLASSAALTFTATPSFASQVTFFLSAPGSSDPTDAAEKARSYAELLTTERLSGDVVSSLGLNEEPSALASRITARLEADTVLITAWVTDASPAGAQKIAGALSTAFVDIVAELEQPPATPEPTPPAEDGAPPAAAAPSVTATVVQPATLPRDPVSPVPALNLGLGAILGVAAGIGAALALNSARGHIRSLAGLAEVTGAAALGAIWNDPDAHARPLAIIGDSSGSRAEGYRAIRTRLLSLGVIHETVAVVSPHHGDGRTATACNLAVALAQTGRKVALVDGDIRGTGVMHYLGQQARTRAEAAAGEAAGLSGVLTGALPVAAAMRPVRPEGFDVLEVRQSFAGFSELLCSPSMESLLNNLADSYDTVIVDTAALLHSSDGPALAALCDTAIMVARHGQTTRKALQAATDLLRSTPTEMIGGVLNMSPPSGARPGRQAEQVRRATPAPDTATQLPDLLVTDEPIGTTSQPVPAISVLAHEPATVPPPRHRDRRRTRGRNGGISPAASERGSDHTRPETATGPRGG